MGPLSYTPSNWYWSVAGSATQVWHSGRCAYVPLSDSVYVAWMAAGGVPTRITSEAELADVLAAQYPPGWPPTLAHQAGALLAGGLTVTSASTPALNGTYACDASAISHITAEMLAVVANGTFADGATEVAWADMNGVPHAFPTIASWKPFALAVGQFVAAATKAAIGASTVLPPNTAAIP